MAQRCMEQLSTEELLLLGRMGKQGVSDFLDGLKDPAYNKTKQTRRDDQKRLPLTTLGVARPREIAGDTTAHIWVALEKLVAGEAQPLRVNNPPLSFQL